MALYSELLDKNAPVDASQPPIVVSATQYDTDYQANEVAADAKYRGHKIEITGEIKSIGLDITNSPTVDLVLANFSQVHATLKDDERKAAEVLQKGSEVTLDCKGGVMVASSTFVDECTIKN